MVNMVRGQPSRLMGLEPWDGWLIAGNTQDVFVIQNKLILHGHIHFKTKLHFSDLSTHFPNTTKEFLHLLENISNNPLPPSHPENRLVNVCKHKFAYTNVTPKRRNGAHFYNSCASLRMSNKTQQDVLKQLEVNTDFFVIFSALSYYKSSVETNFPIFAIALLH